MTCIPVPLFETSQRFELLWCNKAYEELLGHPFEKLMGHKWKDVLPLHAFSSHEEAIADFEETVKRKSDYKSVYPYP